MIDAHIHLDQYSDKDIEKIICNQKLDGVIAVAMDLNSSIKLLELKKQHNKIHIAAGFHPEQLLPDETTINALEEWIFTHQDDIVAIGEIGLPQYLNREGKINDMDAYIQLLERMVKLASHINKPVVLHAVYDDALTALQFLEQYNVKGHFHWFKASDEVLIKVIQSGHMLSVTPDVVWNPKTRRVIELTPLHQLMIETDGPWPHEGLSSTDIEQGLSVIMKVISELKNMDVSEIRSVIHRNTRSFYLEDTI